MASIYRFARRHHTWDILDAAGLVGTIGFDRVEQNWWAVACGSRFPHTDDLHTTFDGHFYHRFATFEAVHIHFGVPLPTLLAMTAPDADELAADITLVATAHARGASILHDTAEPVTGAGEARAAA